MSKVKYSEPSVELCTKKGKSALNVERAKELAGWQDEGDQDFGNDFLFRDVEGNKVRLKHNMTNRPFRISLAKRYASEMLRGKWALNMETIVFDRFGMIQSGQHRLVGLVFAEQMRKKNTEAHGRSPITIECVLGFGCSEKAEVVDTMDLGQKRSLGDIIFRNHDFKTYTEREQKRLSNMLSHATRLVWLRLGGQTVSSAPWFPPSEALDFMQAHPNLRQAVEFVFNEDGGSGAEGKKISSLMSLGYAAGLLYLMSVARTDPTKFERTGKVDMSLKDKGEEFWTLFASGAGLEKGNPILTLRNLLPKIDASGAMGRDEVVGTVIKAFNLWIEGKSAKNVKDVKVKRTKNPDTGKVMLGECPRIGGLDVEPPEPADEEAEVPEDGPVKGKKSKNGWARGDLAWVNDPDGEHWFGEVRDVYETEVEGVKGKKASVYSEAEDKEWEVDAKDLRILEPKPAN